MAGDNDLKDLTEPLQHLRNALTKPSPNVGILQNAVNKFRKKAQDYGSGIQNQCITIADTLEEAIEVYDTNKENDNQAIHTLTKVAISALQQLNTIESGAFSRAKFFNRQETTVDSPAPPKQNPAGFGAPPPGEPPKENKPPPPPPSRDPAKSEQSPVEGGDAQEYKSDGLNLPPEVMRKVLPGIIDEIDEGTRRVMDAVAKGAQNPDALQVVTQGLRNGELNTDDDARLEESLQDPAFRETVSAGLNDLRAEISAIKIMRKNRVNSALIKSITKKQLDRTLRNIGVLEQHMETLNSRDVELDGRDITVYKTNAAEIGTEFDKFREAIKDNDALKAMNTQAKAKQNRRPRTNPLARAYQRLTGASKNIVDKPSANAARELQEATARFVIESDNATIPLDLAIMREQTESLGQVGHDELEQHLVAEHMPTTMARMSTLSVISEKDEQPDANPFDTLQKEWENSSSQTQYGNTDNPFSLEDTFLQEEHEEVQRSNSNIDLFTLSEKDLVDEELSEEEQEEIKKDTRTLYQRMSKLYNKVRGLKQANTDKELAAAAIEVSEHAKKADSAYRKILRALFKKERQKRDFYKTFCRVRAQAYRGACDGGKKFKRRLPTEKQVLLYTAQGLVYTVVGSLATAGVIVGIVLSPLILGIGLTALAVKNRRDIATYVYNKSGKAKDSIFNNATAAYQKVDEFHKANIKPTTDNIKTKLGKARDVAKSYVSRKIQYAAGLRRSAGAALVRSYEDTKSLTGRKYQEYKDSREHAKVVRLEMWAETAGPARAANPENLEQDIMRLSGKASGYSLAEKPTIEQIQKNIKTKLTELGSTNLDYPDVLELRKELRDARDSLRMAKQYSKEEPTRDILIQQAIDSVKKVETRAEELFKNKYSQEESFVAWKDKQADKEAKKRPRRPSTS